MKSNLCKYDIIMKMIIILKMFLFLNNIEKVVLFVGQRKGRKSQSILYVQ